MQREAARAAPALDLAAFQTSAEADEGAAAAAAGEKRPRRRPRRASGAKPMPTRAVGRYGVSEERGRGRGDLGCSSANENEKLAKQQIPLKTAFFISLVFVEIMKVHFLD